jgi:hypothetical protein
MKLREYEGRPPGLWQVRGWSVALSGVLDENMISHPTAALLKHEFDIFQENEK